MNRIVKTFEKAFETAKKKGWNMSYIGCDIHETILKPTWSKELSTEYYSYSKEVLKLLSNREDICLILWSCSVLENNKKYQDFFKKDGIIFDYINENPIPATEYADFKTKLYFSVILDDKAGFDPEEDWLELYKYLTEEYKIKYKIKNDK